MASYNSITLLGNIGSVRVKTFSNGGKVVEASLATTKRWKDRNNESHEETQWHNLVIGGNLADVAERFVEKGAPLFVTGEMTYRTYTDREGVDRSTAEVRVQALQLLPKSTTVQAVDNAAKQVAAPAPEPENPHLAELTSDEGSDDLPF